jgi:hypothetical protein
MLSIGNNLVIAFVLIAVVFAEVEADEARSLQPLNWAVTVLTLFSTRFSGHKLTQNSDVFIYYVNVLKLHECMFANILPRVLIHDTGRLVYKKQPPTALLQMFV